MRRLHVRGAIPAPGGGAPRDWGTEAWAPLVGRSLTWPGACDILNRRRCPERNVGAPSLDGGGLG